MRIAQVLLPGASYYDRKSFQIDHDGLSARHELTAAAGAALVHVYGPPGFEAPNVPYIASGLPRRRFGWRKARQPSLIVSPLHNLPEAVDESWFAVQRGRTRAAAARTIVATFAPTRVGVANMIEQTLSRIHRFRDDIDWLVFDTPPSTEDLAGVDAWVDPATSEDDYDGFVAEAVVAGKAVVASRTEINTRRLDKGMSGFLVPPGDPNELTHAILGALFKSEVASLKIESARQTVGKFRPRSRLRALEKIYEAVIS